MLLHFSFQATSFSPLSPFFSLQFLIIFNNSSSILSASPSHPPPPLRSSPVEGQGYSKFSSPLTLTIFLAHFTILLYMQRSLCKPFVNILFRRNRKVDEPSPCFLFIFCLWEVLGNLLTFRKMA